MIQLTWQLSLYRLTTIKWWYIQERIHGDYKSGHYYNVVKNNDQYILNDLTPEADFSDLDVSDLINASSKLNASFLSGTVPLSAIPSLSSDYIKTFSGTNNMIPKITNNGKTLTNGYGVATELTASNRNSYLPTEGAVNAALTGKLPTYSDATGGHVMLSVAGGTSVRASEISIRSTADQPIGNAPTNLLTENVIYEALKTAGIPQLATTSEADAFLTEENEGKCFIYIGETNSTYTRGHMYLVSSEESTFSAIDITPTSADVKDSLQITVPSVTQSVKFVLETSTTGASSSWTTQISYSQAVQLEFMNPSSGNLTTNPSNSISTNYSGMTMIVKPSQMGNPAAGTYYRYQFITGTSTSAEKWVLGIFGSSSNGDFKTIQSRLSTLESGSSSSDLSTRMTTAENNITTLSSTVSSKPSLGNTTPANLAATANAGSSSQAARADHIHSTSGLVTIDSSSLSSVISIAIVSGSLPSTVSNNVLYFVLGGDSSEGGSTPSVNYLKVVDITGTYSGNYLIFNNKSESEEGSIWKHSENEYYIGYTGQSDKSWKIYSNATQTSVYGTVYAAISDVNTGGRGTDFTSPVNIGNYTTTLHVVN